MQPQTTGNVMQNVNVMYVIVCRQPPACLPSEANNEEGRVEAQPVPVEHTLAAASEEAREVGGVWCVMCVWVSMCAAVRVCGGGYGSNTRWPLRGDA